MRIAYVGGTLHREGVRDMKGVFSDQEGGAECSHVETLLGC